jgi:hypothetical protein
VPALLLLPMCHRRKHSGVAPNNNNGASGSVCAFVWVVSFYIEKGRASWADAHRVLCVFCWHDGRQERDGFCLCAARTKAAAVATVAAVATAERARLTGAGGMRALHLGWSDLDAVSVSLSLLLCPRPLWCCRVALVMLCCCASLCCVIRRAGQVFLCAPFRAVVQAAAVVWHGSRLLSRICQTDLVGGPACCARHCCGLERRQAFRCSV